MSVSDAPSRWLRTLLLAAVAGLAGCGAGDPAAALLEDYRTRVERTLIGSVGPPAVLRIARWPRPRDRLHELPRRRIDLLDFASLHDCGLAALVGERSSSLGRVMSAPLQLRYSQRFVALGERCREAADDRDDVALLGQLLADKAADLGPLGWNATMGSSALAAAFAPPKAALEPGRVRGAGLVSASALAALAARLDGVGEQDDDAAWLAPWAALERDAFAGRLLRALALIEAELGAVNRALAAQHDGDGPRLCASGRAGDRARILQTVFRQRYAGGVQGYLAAVEFEAGRWAAAMATLRSAQRVAPPPAFGPDPVAEALARVAAIRARHTALWQQTFAACGLSPVAVSGGR